MAAKHLKGGASPSEQPLSTTQSEPVFASADDASYTQAATATTEAAADPEDDDVEVDWPDLPEPTHHHHSGDGHHHHHRHHHSRRRRRRRVIITVVSVLLVLVVALGVSGYFLYNSAKSVMADAQTAVEVAKRLDDDLMADDGSFATDAAEVSRLATEMDDELSSPLWAAATFIPVYGSDVSAARTLVSSLRDVSDAALVPLSTQLAATPLSSLAQDGGVLDVTAIQALCDTVANAAPTLHEANDSIQAIGETHIEQLTSAVDTAKESFATLDGMADVAEGLADTLPDLLGANGDRNYLIVAETNSEIRTCGGFSGASGVLTISNGQISLGEFEKVQTLADFGGNTDQVTITDEEYALFQPDGATLNYTAGDSYFTPDFPRGSEITRTLWSITHDGQLVDGVIALDPTLLQYIMQVTGGVTAVDGTWVDGTNAAKVLLSDVYWNYPTDNTAQDAVFTSVASATFDVLMGNLGSLDLAQLAKAVERGAEEGRLLMWMANDEAEAAICELGIDGSLPSDESEPETGVYVNNYSYSKLDWYLNLETQVGASEAKADGSVSYEMTVTLTNTMSEEEAANLPAYVQAHSGRVDSPAQELLGLYLYAPAGGTITNVQSSYEEMQMGTHDGLDVAYDFVKINPGETITVTYTVTVPTAGADEELEVRVTPTAQAAREGTAAEAL